MRVSGDDVGENAVWALSPDQMLFIILSCVLVGDLEGLRELEWRKGRIEHQWRLILERNATLHPSGSGRTTSGAGDL